eukprot:symbB.v1.2.007365.t1/scaffold451.1/size378644/11
MRGLSEGLLLMSSLHFSRCSAPPKVCAKWLTEKHNISIVGSESQRPRRPRQDANVFARVVLVYSFRRVPDSVTGGRFLESVRRSRDLARDFVQDGQQVTKLNVDSAYWTAFVARIPQRSQFQLEVESYVKKAGVPQFFSESVVEGGLSLDILLPPASVERASSSRAGALEDLSKLDHWVALKECRLVGNREEETPEDFLLEEGDVLRSVDHSMARIFRDGNVRWLHVPPGSQVFKAPDQSPAFQGGLPKQGQLREDSTQAYVKLEAGEEIFLRRHKAVETGTSITELSSYGEPWVVEHEQVVVRRGPSTKDQPLGVMVKAVE